MPSLSTGNYDLETQIFEQIEEQAIMIGTYMGMGTIKKLRNDKSRIGEAETPSSIQCTKFRADEFNCR